MLRACERAPTRVADSASNEHKERLQLAPFSSQAVCVLGALMEKGLSPLWTLGSGGQRHWWCSLFSFVLLATLLKFPITTFPELMRNSRKWKG